MRANTLLLSISGVFKYRSTFDRLCRPNKKYCAIFHHHYRFLIGLCMICIEWAKRNHSVSVILWTGFKVIMMMVFKYCKALHEYNDGRQSLHYYCFSQCCIVESQRARLEPRLLKVQKPLQCYTNNPLFSITTITEQQQVVSAGTRQTLEFGKARLKHAKLP